MRAPLAVLLLAACSSPETPVSVHAPLAAGQLAVLVVTDRSGTPLMDPQLFEGDDPTFRFTASAKSEIRIFAIAYAVDTNGFPDLLDCEVSFDEALPQLPSPAGVWSTPPVRLDREDSLELSPDMEPTPFALRSSCDPCGVEKTHLDPDFGDDGTAVLALRGEPNGRSGDLDRDRGEVIVVDDAGRILFGGETYSDERAYFDLGLIRLMPDGTLDTSFGSDGKVVSQPIGPVNVRGLQLDRQGRIVVAGYNNPNNFVLYRFDDSGAPDPTFGDNGAVVTDVICISANFTNQSLALQSDGKILIGGTSSISESFSIARYTEDGTLDPTFGGDGTISIDPTDELDFINSVRVQDDDRIVIAGTASHGDTTGQFALVRLNPDGSLDASFDDDGVVLLDRGGRSGALGVAIQDDGKIVAVGSTKKGAYSGTDVPQDSVLARWLPNGALDGSFGDRGVVIAELDGLGFDAAYEVIVAPDGKLVVSGAWTDVQSGRMFVARFGPNGSKDTCFGDDGVFSDYAARREDRAHSLVRLDDGSLLVAGCAECAICANCDTYGDFLVFKVAP
jgi:uncharacterized delta-60 repeat protein